MMPVSKSRMLCELASLSSLSVLEWAPELALESVPVWAANSISAHGLRREDMASCEGPRPAVGADGAESARGAGAGNGAERHLAIRVATTNLGARRKWT